MKPVQPEKTLAAPESKVTGEGGKPAPGSPTGSTQQETKPAAPPPPGPPPKPAPKNPGMVTFTVDGKEVVTKPGTNMIEAAKQVGVEIPYYCYHPRLSIAANCRMCLVESSTAPKLVPACQTGITEGMVVKTNTQRVQEQQRAVQEFLLLNHPVDCAICDQAGECKLQDYYMRHDAKPSRLMGPKILREKRKVLGPQVVLDQERCIMCTRCVRFMAEVAKEPQLGVFGRGSHEVIDTFPGQQLDSNYSANIVDLCPVGALLNRDFRFRARSWYLSSAPSICTGCSRGCNTFADFFGQDTYRYRPRENEQINKSWLCDHGRLTYKAINTARVLHPHSGRGTEGEELPVVQAVKLAAEKLKPFARGANLAVMASATCSNEDLLAGLAFARDQLGVKAIYVAGRPDGKADHFLLTGDRNPNRKGLEWIARAFGLELRPFDQLITAIDEGKVKALFGLGAEIPVEPAVFAAVAQNLEVFVVQAQNHSPVTEQAHLILPASSHVEDEASFVNVDGIIQRVRRAYPARADSQPHWRWVSDLARELGGDVLYVTSAEVWTKWAPSVTELASFDWNKAAPFGTPKGIHNMPAAADGRPPGYREYGVPRVRGL